MVVRNSTTGLFSFSPKFSPSDFLYLINVQLEQVPKEQGIILPNLWQMTFYFVLKNKTFCMTIVDYCGGQLRYKYCARLNKGMQSPVHLEELSVGTGVPEPAFWRHACHKPQPCWELEDRGLRTLWVAYLQKEFCIPLHLRLLVSDYVLSHINICARCNIWWILNTDFLK